MKTIVVTIVCTWCVLSICAQPVWLSIRDQPLPGTYSRHFQRLFTAMQNEAALGWLDRKEVGVATERRFMLNALSAYGAAAVFPTGSGTFAGMIQQAGYRYYKEQSVGLAYGHALGMQCSIGLQAAYYSRHIAGYGSTGDLVMELGGLFQIMPALIAGMHIVNPMNSGAMPVIYTAGLGYEVEHNFLLSTAMIQESGVAPVIKLMCEYAIIPACILQLAWGSEPLQNSVGAAFVLGRMYIRVSASRHPQLGFSPGTMIVWQLKKESV